MKIWKRLLPLSLIFLCIFTLGCSGTKKTDIEEVITGELDLLKNLDSETTMKYISHKELFPEATENAELSAEIKEVFSLFFRDFDYKIKDIKVDRKKKTATAAVQMNTLDAKTLARDYTAARLEREILEAAGQTSDPKPNENSLEERYLLLRELLTTQEYKTAKRDSTIQLTCTDTEENVWEIQRSYSLENDLVGGLITYLADPDILSPEDTLEIYLSALKNMDISAMSSYLGVESLLNNEDADKGAIASALVEQVYNTFDYKITDCKEKGYNAVIETEITTFDSESILKEYEEKLDAYLSTLEAVIDGAEKRYEISLEMLLDCIESNEKTITSNASFRLINDGTSWKLTDSSEELGNAIFGTLSVNPLGTEEAPEGDISYESDYEEDYEDAYTGDYEDA